MGPEAGGPPAAGWPVGSSIDCARGGFLSCATYLDTFNQRFGGCFVRSLPPEAERLLSALSCIDYTQQLTKVTELIDKTLALCSAFDATCLPSGTQQDIPG